jgi:ring-1,2-phenylacetyl-CoA epoxidase subunit PaaB
MQWARENFLRRDSAVSLWVVQREHIDQTSTDFLARELDREYREVRGYTENGRLWRMFKEKTLTIEEIVAAVEEKNRNLKSKNKK